MCDGLSLANERVAHSSFRAQVCAGVTVEAVDGPSSGRFSPGREYEAFWQVCRPTMLVVLCNFGLVSARASF